MRIELLFYSVDTKDLHWHWLFVSLICSCFYWSYLACYRVDSLAHRQIKIVNDKYLDGNSGLTVEAINRSNKACGPLYQWTESQIKYSSIYNSIQPLREEVEQLETDAKVANDESSIANCEF
jgi:dynein heavy chain 1